MKIINRMDTNSINNRKKGLAYILDKMDKRGLVTTDDVIIFMEDLHLPPMTSKQMKQKFLIAGGSDDGITKLTIFFQFVLNQLQTNSDN